MKVQKIPTLEQAYSGTLFGSDTVPQSGEAIVELSPSELEEIKDQPFHAYSSDKLSELADSILENGQQQPCIVRKKDGKFIILAGRNRKRACEQIGVKVKCIVRECSDAEADIILTDTNLYQRHELLPSELASAYAMQHAAYEAKGERKSTAAIANAYGETIKTVYRYIKLNDLDKSLIPFVDEGRIPVMAGVVLTKAESPVNQQRLSQYLDSHIKLKISVKQAEDLISLEKEHCWYSDILDNFFAGKMNQHSTPQEPNPAPSRDKPSGTLYYCKCGMQIRKNTNADTTGNRLENYQVGHECWGCPYVCPLYAYQEKEDGSFRKVITDYECRMSKGLVYYSSITSFVDDNSNSYISSLDLSFLSQVKEYIQTLDGGIISCDYDVQRGADYTSDGRIRMTITFEKNKKGIAVKKAITEKFFSPDNSRLNITADDERQLVQDELRTHCPTSPGILLANTDGEKAQNIVTQSSEAEAKKPYHRLTSKRCNGIKEGYWSPNTKEELVQRLAEYEDMFPEGPYPVK